MSSVSNPTSYVPEISDIEGKFFTDIEAVLSSMTKPIGKGADQKAPLLTDEQAAKYGDELGSKLKSKYFTSGDLVLLGKSFEAEKNSATFDFSTVLKRADLFGRDSDPTVAVAPKADESEESTNVEVTVNVGGTQSPKTPTSTSNSNLSPLAADVYGALKSLQFVDSSLQRSIRNGDINKYTIGTMERPGAWTKVTANNVAARGIVVDKDVSQLQLNKAVIDVLNRMLAEYQDELDEAKDA